MFKPVDYDLIIHILHNPQKPNVKVKRLEGGEAGKLGGRKAGGREGKKLRRAEEQRANGMGQRGKSS